jgi:PRTRC genetic system protein E
MKTNFFEQLAGLSLTGTLQLNIHTAENGNLTVSLLLSPSDPKITGAKNLPPLLCKGTAQELDENFFAGITAPVKETSAFIIGLETYQAALEKAKKTAKPEKEKTGKGTPENADEDDPNKEHADLFAAAPDDKEAKAEKKKRYDDAMQQIKELNGQMKYKEAIALLPDAEEYPDKAAEIKAKGEELRKRQQVLETLQQEV